MGIYGSLLKFSMYLYISPPLILISIHANALGNGSQWMKAQGWSAYTSKGQTKADILAECLYDAAAT